MPERADRIQDLADKVKEYTKKEKTRIDDAVKTLAGILDKRTGGAAIQKIATKVVKEVANHDLQAYLQGK